MITEEFNTFVRTHIEDDLPRLVLDAAKYPGVDVRAAALRIEGLRKIKDKLPEWYACSGVVIPAPVSAEQCSSAFTGEYKQRFITPGTLVYDLTGGLGVDSFYFARAGARVLYAEPEGSLCRGALHNFKALGCAHSITVVQSTAESLWDFLPDLPSPDMIYLDPSRRTGDNSRIYDLEACSPNVVELRELLLHKAPRVLIKISPMADISRIVTLLPATKEIHILSARNECKEILVFMERESTKTLSRRIFCEPGFSFLMEEESRASAEREALLGNRVPTPGHYLYEPGASVMKSGAFFLTAQRYAVSKFHTNSHLYYSDKAVPDFPGRSFVIERVLPFSSRELRRLSTFYPKANLAVRNFPLSVAQWRQRTRIADGGNDYLFGTTVRTGSGDGHFIICTTKIDEKP